MKTLLPFACLPLARDKLTEWLLMSVSLEFFEIWLDLPLIFDDLHQVLLGATGFDSEVVVLGGVMLLPDLGLDVFFVLSGWDGLDDCCAVVRRLRLLSVLGGSSLLVLIVSFLNYHHLNALIVEAAENLPVSILY